MLDLIRDIRIGFRSLRKRPLLLGTATVTLGLGLGAGTGVFSVVEAALLQPLPFPDADELVVVWGVAGPEQDIRGASPIEIRDWDAAVDALGPLTRYNETRVNQSGAGEAAQLEAEMVGVEFFSVLGVAPALGRVFVPEDDQPGAAGSAVISHDLWRQWGGTADVLGRTVRLDDVPFTVVGVMPEGFRGLSFDTEIWVPLGPFASAEGMAARGGRWLAALGRLVPGANEERAQAQVSAAAERLEEAYPDTNRDRGALLIPLREFYTGQSRPLLLMVLGGVGLLLLIACANVANLQLVRAVERRRELALRYALGAGRSSVARQLLAESLVLAATGAAAGLVVAWVGIQMLIPLVPGGVLPPYAEPAVDGVVLGFAVVAALMAAALFALAPAMRAGREDPAHALRGAARGGSAEGWRAGRIGSQQVIIAVEVALALILLVGAGLALRSLQAQLELEPGFDAGHMLTARVALTGDDYDRARRVAFADGIAEDLRGIAGVEHAAIASAAPLRGYTSASYIFRAEDPTTPDYRIRFYLHSVTPGAFETLRVSIIDGRGFTDADDTDAPGVVVVSRSFAAKVWPGEDAVGRRVIFGGDTATVVGVAGDVRYRTLTTDLMDPGEDPDVYFAYAQVPTSSFDLLVRSDGDPATLTGAIRDALRQRDPGLPLFDVATLESVLAQQTALDRMVSSLLAVFAATALIIAAVGLYGVLAFVVRRRRREIAIRGAIGASPRAIVRMVMRQGIGLVAAGLVLGLAGAVVAGRIASSLMFGIRPVDPLILGATTLTLLLAAGLASYLPARQAARIQPHVAMADE